MKRIEVVLCVVVYEDEIMEVVVLMKIGRGSLIKGKKCGWRSQVEEGVIMHWTMKKESALTTIQSQREQYHV